jgi:mersacidin/lichenicidin family type 2 lantibiotic
MQAEVTVRAWKDPAFADALRDAGTAAPPSPAGEVVLDDVDLTHAGAGPGEVPKTPMPYCIISVVSVVFSCLGCDTTLWDGTCGAASIGCCPNAA